MSVKANLTIEKGKKEEVIKKFKKQGLKVKVLKFKEGKNVDYLTLLLD